MSAPATADGRGATTLMFWIFAKPSVRRPVTSAAIIAPRGSLLASTIGITARRGGARLDSSSGFHTGTAAAIARMMAQSPVAATTAARRGIPG